MLDRVEKTLHPRQNPDALLTSVQLTEKQHEVLADPNAPEHERFLRNEERTDGRVTHSFVVDEQEFYPSGELRSALIPFLTKGIIPVADIVFVENKYSKPARRYVFSYSCAMRTDEAEVPLSESELKAGMLLLDTLFGDWDHSILPSDPAFPGDTQITHIRDHNFVRTEDGRSGYFFDFTGMPPRQSPLGRSFAHEIERLEFHLRGEKDETKLDILSHLAKLLHRFSSHLEGKRGRDFFTSVLAKIERETFKDPKSLYGRSEEELYEDTMAQIDLVKTLVATVHRLAKEAPDRLWRGRMGMDGRLVVQAIREA